jgi:hypothetical protein
MTPSHPHLPQLSMRKVLTWVDVAEITVLPGSPVPRQMHWDLPKRGMLLAVLTLEPSAPGGRG